MSDFDVGFVIFPGITQLDFTGPFEVLSRLATPPSVSVPSRFPHSRTHVIAKSLHPVSSDRGLSILPTCTFDNSPSLNLICVPGGAGVVDALADVETVDFIRRQGAHAQFVTSVCIGAFLLGAAGLLKGRRAATHWAYVDLLPLVGASHERSRIVATATSSLRAASLQELISHSASWRNLPGPRLRKPFNSPSSTTPRLPSMPVTRTRQPKRRRHS
jgi:cyclohexyl-isocyanide hydratase